MGIKEIEIKNIDQLNSIIWEQKYHDSIKRNRSNYLYRGIPNVDFRLVTSLQRNCGIKKDDIESSILRNFTKYAAIEDPILNSSVWRQLIIGQHHGLPTRLLDWTYSVLVALHFATSGEELGSMDRHDCALWKIDILEMNRRLPLRYQNILKSKNAFLMTVDMMDELTRNERNEQEALKRYDEDMEGRAMVLLEPPSLDQRIISQYSYFSVIPSVIEHGGDDLGIEEFLDDTNNTVKYIIDAGLKWRIRDMLDQMNINERIVYPGLDGLTMWLKRHYYVKK